MFVCLYVCIDVFNIFSLVWLFFFFFKQKTAYEMRISDWSSDVCSSDRATLLRRTAPVVRDWRHVDDVGDLVADVVERTYGRLSARTRTLDAHFQRLHAVVERGLSGLLGGDLGCERGRLARTADARAARSRPRQRVALAVGAGDDGVVERSGDRGDAFGDDALDLLLRLGSGWLGHFCT